MWVGLIFNKYEGKSITTGTLFSETLYYNESFGGNTPRYDGNISAMAWKADAKNRAFRYAYDKFGRLSSAVYLEEGVANQHYDESFTYDKMGNVQSITRYGLQDNSQYGLIDNVSLYYIGNQVVHADDAVTDGPNYAGAFHFRDSNGTQWDTEYEYDKNGRLTRDRNKGILQIQYNLLNLPSKTTFSDGGYINYQYSASGMKQMVSGSAPGQGYKSQFYLGNYVYGNGVKQLLVDGGYVTFSGTTPQYHFYVKDHLGNNRMVVNASGTVEQVNHYYAFGGLMGENTGSDLQDFKYNGKELDRLHGLDWYDYNARHMDAVRGVFTTMDPLAEKYYNISPYAYCANNPINAYDPDGRTINIAAGALFGAGTEYVSQVVGNVVKDGLQFEDFTNVDFGDITIAGAVGAATSGVSALSVGAKAFRTAITAMGEAFKAHYDVEMKNGDISVSVNNSSKTTNNLVAAGVGVGAGKVMGKTLSKTPMVSSASTNKSTRKLTETVKKVVPNVSNKEARSMANKIKPGVNSTMRGVKKITDAVRASSSKAETATSGAVQGVLTDEKDKR